MCHERSPSQPLRSLLPLPLLFLFQPLTRIETSMLEPFPLRRAVLHYRLGLPWLGRLAFVRGALGAVEAAFGRMLAPARWSYVALTAERTA